MGSDNKPSTSALMNETVKVNYIFLIAFSAIPLAIGYAIAIAIFKYGDTDKYSKRITDGAAEDTYWLHLATVVLGRMIAFVNARPMSYKKGLEGNVRSNPFIYKINNEGNANDVVFASEGTKGQYNRANRSVHHMIENYGAFLVGMVVTGSVFPFEVFVLACFYSVGRILHQAGYIQGYGKHAPGFLMDMLAKATMEGLSLLVFVKGSGITL